MGWGVGEARGSSNKSFCVRNCMKYPDVQKIVYENPSLVVGVNFKRIFHSKINEISKSAQKINSQTPTLCHGVKVFAQVTKHFC